MSVKISELPVLDSLADNDVLAGVDTSANTTSKVTLGSLKQYIDTNTQYTAGTNIDITNNVVSAPNVYNKTETDGLLSAKEDTANKVTSITSSNTNTQYPSAKSVYDHVSGVSNDIMDSVTEATSALQEENEALKEELESVSTIFNAFPVDSDEDESMTLEDTAEVKFKKFDLKGNTYQTQYSGKNLLPPTIATETKNGITLTNNGDGSYTLTGTYSSSTEFSIDLPTTLNGTYSFSGNNPASSNNIQFRILTSSGSPWSTYLNNVNKTSEDQTIENGTKQGIRIVGSFTSGFTLKPQLESGLTATSYEPYVGGSASPNPEFSQPVNVVSGDNEIVVTSKNRLGYPSFSSVTFGNVTFTNNKGVYTISTSGTSTTPTSTDFYNVPKYTIQEGDYIQYNNDIADSHIGFTLGLSDGSNYFNSFANKNRIVSLSSKVGLTIEKVRFNFNSGYTLNGTCSPMVVNSSTSIPFEECVGDTYNIDLPVENLAQNNLVDETYNSLQITKNSDGSFTLNGKPTSSFGRDIDTNITLKKGTYTISANAVPSGLYIALDNTTETQLSSGTLSKTFTLASDTTYTSLGIWFTKEKNYNVTIKLQLEKGSKANSYTPYGTTPIELCKIGNYQDGFGKSDGSQLFDKDNADTLNGFITNTGSINSSANTKSLYIPCKPNTTYTISKVSSSRFVAGTTSNTPNIGDTVSDKNDFSTATKGTLTTSSSANYLVVYYYSSTNDTLTEQQIRNSIMINEGSFIPWQPYGVGKWYLHKEIGKRIFNGDSSENWLQRSGSSGTISYFQIAVQQSSTYSVGDKLFKALSSHFEYNNYTAPSPGNFLYVQSGYNIFFRLNKDNGTSVSDFKNWLATNNIMLYYQLNTPTNTEITYQPLIDQLNLLERAQSKENQTNISQVNNDLPFIISTEAILSLQNVLDRIELLES